MNDLRYFSKLSKEQGSIVLIMVDGSHGASVSMNKEQFESSPKVYERLVSVLVEKIKRTKNEKQN